MRYQRLPRAPSRRWYPQSFLAPLDGNAPHREDSLRYLDDLMVALGEAGIGY
jgi:hypothetical protein